MDKQIYRKDLAECVLCMDPPCSEACSEMDAGRILRSIWFDNERGAALKLTEACVSCNGECEKACIRDVPIRKVMLKLSKVQADRNMILDEKLLESNICGIRI